MVYVKKLSRGGVTHFPGRGKEEGGRISVFIVDIIAPWNTPRPMLLLGILGRNNSSHNIDNLLAMAMGCIVDVV